MTWVSPYQFHSCCFIPPQRGDGWQDLETEEGLSGTAFLPFADPELDLMLDRWICSAPVRDQVPVHSTSPPNEQRYLLHHSTFMCPGLGSGLKYLKSPVKQQKDHRRRVKKQKEDCKETPRKTKGRGK
ncbi:hypothetical protein QOT17_016691 [Balamuthia mandrillaris]